MGSIDGCTESVMKICSEHIAQDDIDSRYTENATFYVARTAEAPIREYIEALVEDAVNEVLERSEIWNGLTVAEIAKEVIFGLAGKEPQRSAKRLTEKAGEVIRMGSAPDFSAIVKTGEKRWEKIGAAWKRDGKISILLRVAPIPDSGRISFLLVPNNSEE